MSELRQVAEGHDEQDQVRIRALAYNYAPGAKLPVHYHDWAQLIYASSGVMSVHTEAGSWVVPAQRAVWVPAEVRHRIDMSGPVAMRTLYLSPALAPFGLRECAVLNVAPLLRELVLHAVEHAPLHA